MQGVGFIPSPDDEILVLRSKLKGVKAKEAIVNIFSSKNKSEKTILTNKFVSGANNVTVTSPLSSGGGGLTRHLPKIGSVTPTQTPTKTLSQSQSEKGPRPQSNR